jgi:hypothetical protein
MILTLSISHSSTSDATSISGEIVEFTTIGIYRLASISIGRIFLLFARA